jgi:Xaa-Pro aminopeptidase
MTRAGLSGLVITHLPDVRYLTGFTGDNASLSLTRHAAALFTDSRFATQAAEEVTAAQVKIASGPASTAGVQWLAAQPGVVLAGFNPDLTTVSDLVRWKESLPKRLQRNFFTPIPAPFLNVQRMIKDADEIELMRKAALVGCQVFDHILGYIRPGLREVDVAAELEHEARRRGAEGMSFDTIAAAGARSALPHGRATSAVLPKRGFFTLDFGVILNGYCSDMTRTVYLGAPKQDERDSYGAVLEAQEAAVAAVRPGVSCAEVDEAARGLLRQAGLAEAFTHSTGHGVGLEIHEQPRIGAGQMTRLQEGMVITIEPGVYFPGRYGIRIEDMVVVTQTGGEVLTPAPKALIEL